MKDYVFFSDDIFRDDNILNIDYKEISACLGRKSMHNKTLCVKNDDKYRQTFPSKNLVNDTIDNSENYYIRLSDEIIRNSRINVLFNDSSKLHIYTKINITENIDDDILLYKSELEDYFRKNKSIKISGKESLFITHDNVNLDLKTREKKDTLDTFLHA